MGEEEEEVSQDEFMMEEELIGERESIVDHEFDDESIGDKEPNLDHEFHKAKVYLQKPSSFTGDSLYDHLSDLLNKVLGERPQNIIDFFEDYSRKLKECRYKDATDHLRDIYIPTLEVDRSLALQSLIFPNRLADFEGEGEELEDRLNVQVLEDLSLLQETGIGLPKSDMYILQLSLRKLALAEPLRSLRFWGKIYGLEADYYIAEGEISDEGIARLEAEEEEEEEEEPEPEEMLEEEMNLEDVPKIPRKKPPIPKLIKLEEKVTPCERYATGANKKMYYVSHRPGIDPWIKLPDVTPQQIIASRKITKYLTGNLEQPLETWPEFPGVEKNYLRAQIGRITAGTSVAPIGFYSFFENEEEEEDDVDDEEGGKMRTEIFLNNGYDPVSVKDLNDGTFSFWVHTAMYILPQGRCIWWNPNAKDSEENEEEEEGDKMIEPERGPPLLSTLADDAALETIPPWTVRVSTSLMPEKACASIRSNLWPGSYAVTSGNKCVSIYLGTGHKYTAYNYCPPPLPAVLREYPVGPEILEIQDPSGAQEEAWRIAHEKHPAAEGEGMELEDEEDDDDA